LASYEDLVVGSFSFFFSARLLNRFTEKREKFLLQSIFASIGPLEKNQIAAPFRTFTGGLYRDEMVAWGKYLTSR